MSSSPQAPQVFKINIDKSPEKIIWALPETILDTNLNLEGDVFSGVLTEDSARILNLPFGSRMLGNISEINEAKNLSRDSNLKININQVMLPDGTLVKARGSFKANATMTDGAGKSKIKNTITKITKEGSKVTASAAVGAFDALQYGGMGTAIATEGISIGVGAGIGLGLGLIGLLRNKGEALAATGFNIVGLKSESTFQILEEIPLMSQDLIAIDPELYGFDIEVKSIRKYFSQDYGDFLLFDIDLKNNSAKNFYISDFVLTSKRHVVPLMQNSLITSFYPEPINVNSTHSCKLAFSLGDLKREEDYNLVLIDPVTEKPIVDCRVDLAKYL